MVFAAFGNRQVQQSSRCCTPPLAKKKTKGVVADAKIQLTTPRQAVNTTVRAFSRRVCLSREAAGREHALHRLERAV